MIQEKFKHAVPYGCWTTASGREILFNREYKPLFERMTGAAFVKPANYDERVPDISSETHFFKDGSLPWRAGKPSREAEARVTAVLSSWNLDWTDVRVSQAAKRKEW